MDRKTADGFVQRIRAHREAEQHVWDEMRDHPEYQPHEDVTIEEVLDALASADDAIEAANSNMEAFDFVPDPDHEGEFVHKDELAERRAKRELN